MESVVSPLLSPLAQAWVLRRLLMMGSGVCVHAGARSYYRLVRLPCQSPRIIQSGHAPKNSEKPCGPRGSLDSKSDYGTQITRESPDEVQTAQMSDVDSFFGNESLSAMLLTPHPFSFCCWEPLQITANKS
ncbi:hypothetical protein BJV78DRAFT_276382 [Lactifluus subvellereus]|nr:hypothetical protein BJV78DRAFT_276382 [Lactifluus subvellereus]